MHPALTTALYLDEIQVVIPALDEAATIGGVVSELKRQGLSRIRVVDNGSSDETAQRAQKAGAIVVYESLPGYGRACWTGLQNLPKEIEWILFCDADGSDVLEELPRFFKCAQQADFVLGNRRASESGRCALTPVQNFGNWLTGSLIRIGWGADFSDLGPLRLIRRRALDQIAMEDRGFGWTVEMQVRAVEEKLRICEVPVSYRDRQGGTSKISGTLKGSAKAGAVILGIVGKLYLRKFSQMLAEPIWQRILLLLSCAMLTVGAWIMTPVGDFRIIGTVPVFLAGAAIMCLGFSTALLVNEIAWPLFWIIALATRFLLLPMYPGDDIWRYLWEGMIQRHGISPYAFAPDASELFAYRTSWWPLINHPDVAAIYPPLTQLGFRLLALGSPSVMLFKLSFLAADLGCCAILQRRLGSTAAMLFAWNPLVIYSFAGGGHYDSWFLLALIGGWLLFEDKKSDISFVASALLLGASIALKYVSLPVTGYAIWKTWREKGLRHALLFTLLASLPFLISLSLVPRGFSNPLVPTEFANVARGCEFIPYWMGLLWPASTRANWLLSIPLAAVIGGLILFSKSIARYAERYFFVLLLLSPSVHAWHFTWIVPFAVKTRNPGIALISMSGFVYFWLHHRQAIYGDWTQSVPLKLLLWMPFILGFWWHERNAWRLRKSHGRS